MKFHNLYLDQECDYRADNGKKKSKRVAEHAVIIGLRVDKMPGQPLCRERQLPMVHVLFDDGSSRWVAPGEINRHWSTHLAEVRGQEKLEQTAKLRPATLRRRDQPYFASSFFRSKLTSKDLVNYSGETIVCMNPFEDWLLRALDGIGIRFEYEPRLFLAEGKGFRPDLYIPELDMYVELSSSLRADAKHKRKKLRMMEKHHADISATVLYWEDALWIQESNPDKSEMYAYLHERVRIRKNNRCHGQAVVMAS